MDDEKGSRTSQPLIIDERAITHIKDRARQIFRDDPGGGVEHLNRVMFKALHYYLVENGVAPGFEVVL